MARLSTFRLNRRDVNYVALTSSANWIGDILCLAFAIAAFEKHLPWTAVVLAWTAGSVATSLQLTPGGLGVVEAALTSALVVGGLHTGDAAAVALTYRAMSYWAPTLSGWAVLGAQQHTPSASAKPASEIAHSRDDRDSQGELTSSTRPLHSSSSRCRGTNSLIRLPRATQPER
jgi:Lysylphosphatidylglycerol synthase TM region